MSGKNSSKSKNKPGDDYSILVYSTDPKDQARLKGENPKQAFDAQNQDLVKSRNFVAIFRLEKNGRGGKTVTVIDGLPKFELFLKDLTKELKSKCGVGGTYLMDGRDGVIEIQGDKREAIKKIFDTKQIKYKGM